MMNDEKYIKMYQNKLGFFKDSLYRGIASEIQDYYEKNKQIFFADFLSYVESSPLKNEIYEVIKSINDENLDETSMEEYISNIKETTWLQKIKELKSKQKETLDQQEKKLIGMEIVEQKKKIEEIMEGRSVKNDKV